MTMREREGLVARIRQIRRTHAAAENPPISATGDPDAARVASLEQRIAQLEHLVEGLQDSVHRESERQGRAIAEIQGQIQPAVMSASLSKDARDRGL